jgi:hypothetical protein
VFRSTRVTECRFASEQVPACSIDAFIKVKDTENFPSMMTESAPKDEQAPFLSVMNGYIYIMLVANPRDKRNSWPNPSAFRYMNSAKTNSHLGW